MTLRPQKVILSFAEGLVSFLLVIQNKELVGFFLFFFFTFSMISFEAQKFFIVIKSHLLMSSTAACFWCPKKSLPPPSHKYSLLHFLPSALWFSSFIEV